MYASAHSRKLSEQIRMAKEAWIGIDLGGSKIAAGVVDAAGRIIRSEKRPTFKTQGFLSNASLPCAPLDPSERIRSEKIDGDRVLENLYKSIRSHLAWAREHGYEVKGISIASPGPVDVEEGIVLNPPNIPFRDLPLRSLCEREFALPVRLEKDTNAAAYGEYISRDSKAESFLYVAVGTGIGGGLILHGEVYRGAGGIAMEIGHLVLDPTGPQCGCGARGCFEALASGSAMKRAAFETGLTLPEDEGVVEHLTNMAHLEPKAKEILEKVALYLAAGVASAVNLLDPDLVVLAGGVIGAAVKVGSPLLNSVIDGIGERTFRRTALRQDVSLVISTLGDRAAIMGGVALMKRALAF
ncbi:MAG TPA: ROK family protein [Clostridia bacterium]|nr:ROK family protein [Clostridia bacterium]